MRSSESTAPTADGQGTGHFASVLRGGLAPFRYRAATRAILDGGAAETEIRPSRPPVPPVSFRYLRQPARLLVLPSPDAAVGRARPDSPGPAGGSGFATADPTPALRAAASGPMPGAAPPDSAAEPALRSGAPRAAAEPTLGAGASGAATELAVPGRSARATAPRTERTSSSGPERDPLERAREPEPEHAVRTEQADAQRPLPARRLRPPDQERAAPDAPASRPRLVRLAAVPAAEAAPGEIGTSVASPRDSTAGDGAVDAGDRAPSPTPLEAPVSVPTAVPHADDLRLSVRLQATRTALAEMSARGAEQAGTASEPQAPRVEVREVVRHVGVPVGPGRAQAAAFWERVHLSRPELRLFK